jgi:hypothetical protein
MKNSNRIRIERLEKVMNINLKKKFAIVICDNPSDFNDRS